MRYLSRWCRTRLPPASTALTAVRVSLRRRALLRPCVCAVRRVRVPRAHARRADARTHARIEAPAHGRAGLKWSVACRVCVPRAQAACAWTRGACMIPAPAHGVLSESRPPPVAGASTRGTAPTPATKPTSPPATATPAPASSPPRSPPARRRWARRQAGPGRLRRSGPAVQAGLGLGPAARGAASWAW